MTQPHLQIPSRRGFLSWTVALPLAAQFGTSAFAQRAGPGNPRLMGINIGAKNYDDAAYQEALARVDVTILGFYPGWKGDRDGSKIRAVVAALKRRNPRLRVGQYTILNESSDDRARSADKERLDKLDRENWWLRRADGAKTQWTAQYGAWDINITDWAEPDRDGDRYPQWLARRNAEIYFDRVPEFDIWYFDNVMDKPRVAKADWRRNGVDLPGKDPDVQAAFRRAHAAHWDAARRLKPGVLLMGNADNDLSYPEYRHKLNAVLLEGLMGKSWSIESWGGWRKMMERYLRVRANLLPPAIVGFNVFGRPDDYRFLRYALASCMLGDGYFAFTDTKVGFSSVPWFDEYEARVGGAAEPPVDEPWSNGVYRRRYENGMVLVNPDTSPRRVDVGNGWRRLKGAQDPSVNSGERAGELMLAPRDGLLLVRA